MAKDETKLESDDELFEADLYRDDSDSEDGADDDDNDGYGTRRQAPRKKEREFQTGMVLTTPRIIQMSVAQLFEDMDSGDIDLEPDYQRNVVWTEEKQSNLISSLLSHFYIPPILLSAHPNSSTGHQYTCIDGKQRLSSIKLFMQNIIPVADASKLKFYYSARGQRKRALPGDVAKRFRRESVPVVIYENLTDAQEREMFQRVQMGVTLSPAEKLSALRTPWTIAFDQLSKKYMDSSRPGENLCHIVRTNRSNDWLFMGQITMTIINQVKRPYLAHYPEVKKFVEREAPPEASQKKEVFNALNRLLVLANNPEYNETMISQRVGNSVKSQLSPVEFVHIAFMCWRHPTASYQELAEWCKTLRVEVHTAFPGQVRYNTPCATLLRKRIESFRPTGNGGEGSGPSRPQKRRYEDDEEDYHPSTSRDSDSRRRGGEPSGSASGPRAVGARTTFYSGNAGTPRQAAAQPQAQAAHRPPLFRRGSSESPGSASASANHSPRIAAPPHSPPHETKPFANANSASGSSSMSRRITPQNPYH